MREDLDKSASALKLIEALNNAKENKSRVEDRIEEANFELHKIGESLWLEPLRLSVSPKIKSLDKEITKLNKEKENTRLKYLSN